MKDYRILHFKNRNFFKVKEQLVVRQNMDVNEDERLSYITL